MDLKFHGYTKSSIIIILDLKIHDLYLGPEVPYLLFWTRRSMIYIWDLKFPIYYFGPEDP